MKKIVLSFLLGLILGVGYAQKVTVKKEVILVDEQQYALLVGKGNLLLGQDLILKTLSGVELIYFKLFPQNLDEGKEGHYEVIFRESGAKGTLPITESRKSIAKLIVENELVKEDKINPEGERRFLQINPYREPSVIKTATASQQTADYTLVQRDRGAMIFVIMGDINQANVLIGRCVEKTVYDQEHGSVKSYKFYLPNGTLVAEAIFKNISDTSGTCITLKDNKRHYVTAKNNLDIAEDVAKFLIDLYYL